MMPIRYRASDLVRSQRQMESCKIETAFLFVRRWQDRLKWKRDVPELSFQTVQKKTAKDTRVPPPWKHGRKILFFY